MYSPGHWSVVRWTTLEHQRWRRESGVNCNTGHVNAEINNSLCFMYKSQYGVDSVCCSPFHRFIFFTKWHFSLKETEETNPLDSSWEAEWKIRKHFFRRRPPGVSDRTLRARFQKKVRKTTTYKYNTKQHPENKTWLKRWNIYNQNIWNLRGELRW